MFQGLWAGIKSKFAGGSFLKGFSEAFNEEMKKSGELINPGKNAANEFADEMKKVKGKFKFENVLDGTTGMMEKELEKVKTKFTSIDFGKAKAEFNRVTAQNKGPDHPLAGWIGALREKTKDIEERIRVTQKLREIRTKKPARESDKPEDKKPASAAAAAAAFSLESGVYGFAAFGEKIQNQLLGKGKDHGAQQVSLMEASNKIQEQQLTATKDNKPKIGLGP